MKYTFTPDDPRRPGKISSDERYPDTHTGQLSSWLLVGPDQVFAKYRLGNLSSTKLEVSVDTYEPGGNTVTHTHPEREQAYYIVRGQAEISIGDEQRIIGAGSAAVIPPGMPHKFNNVGKEPLTLLVISSYL